MSIGFFSAAGKFYRGNLHTHSTRSDGILSPEEVCRRYRAEGFAAEGGSEPKVTKVRILG